MGWLRYAGPASLLGGVVGFGRLGTHGTCREFSPVFSREAEAPIQLVAQVLRFLPSRLPRGRTRMGCTKRRKAKAEIGCEYGEI